MALHDTTKRTYFLDGFFVEIDPGRASSVDVDGDWEEASPADLCAHCLQYVMSMGVEATGHGARGDAAREWGNRKREEDNRAQADT